MRLPGPGPHAVPEEPASAALSPAATPQAREEETIGEPAAGRPGRRGRVTPRQLWQRMQREVATGQAREKPSAVPQVSAVPPVSASDQAEAADEPLENLLDANLTHDVQQEKAEVDPTEDRDQQEPAPEEPEQAETPEAESAAAPAGPDDKPPPKMVEPDKQPGQMRYAHSTHGPAPKTGEKRGSWEEPEPRLSSTFVLGVLIVVVAVLIGLVLVRQHKKISRLEERVTRVEAKLVSPRAATGR